MVESSEYQLSVGLSESGVRIQQQKHLRGGRRKQEVCMLCWHSAPRGRPAGLTDGGLKPGGLRTGGLRPGGLRPGGLRPGGLGLGGLGSGLKPFNVFFL